jgi:hypothetical protein
MLRRKRNLAVLAIIILVPIVAVAWWLLSPLLTSKTVDEEVPFAFTAVVPPNMERADVEKIMAGMALVDNEVTEQMPSQNDMKADVNRLMGSPMIDSITEVMAKTLSDSVMETLPDDMSDAAKQAIMKDIAADMKDALPKVMSEAMAKPPGSAVADSPVKLKEGEFAGQDKFHKGSGRAIIYQSPDGSRLLRLEDFSVTNGPDLRVYLSPVHKPEGAGDVTAQGHVELAKLKGNKGNQNYAIPDDADVTSLRSVVIFCKPFRVIFSVAPLQDVG